MLVVRTIGEVRDARPRFASLGLVPTMGFLHAGHMSLVERARADCGAVAVSIFVNPTQFGEAQDLDRYPRDLPRDLAMLAEAGADLVFAPEPAEIYPAGFSTRIDVGGPTEPLEGASRPGHFVGVATVVAKLFNIFQPTRAYFGQKDAQQTVVIRRMARDLDMPVEVVISPTVRDADGLALSSRNARLSAEERTHALTLFRALTAARMRFEAGERSGAALREVMRAVLAAEPGVEADYVSVAELETLAELDRVDELALASLAARVGPVRLIDNLILSPGSSAAASDHR
ncbi:MAG: pantoate--beta-alanine ligase [Caulobacteraceae bacterium]